MLNETACYTGEFLLSEANGSISRDEIVVASGAGDLAAGTVLGKITASGKYTVYDAAVDPADGSETAVGVLYAPVDATSADAAGVMIARHAEVIEVKLTGIDAGGKTDLAAAQIFVR